jgi:mannose-6-phosphate isomerase-like protein (cupin superfamily)
MDQLSRRHLPLLLSALASTAQAEGQGEHLPSAVFPFDDLPVHKGKTSTSRQIFRGISHSGCPVDLHETDLPPGEMPHPPHRHPNEEVMMIESGQVEITINGKTKTVGPGSAIYVASNDFHGLKNSGTTMARYFVMSIGPTNT